MTFLIGALLFGGALFLLGVLVALWFVFGSSLWWDATERERE